MKDKIKILFAIDTMVIGGASMVVFNQLKNIDKEKFDVYLMTLYPSVKASYLDQINFIPAENIIQFDLKDRSIFDLKTWVRVVRFLKKEKFFVIYTHLFITNLIVRTAAIFSPRTIVLTFEHSIYFNKKFWQKIADHILSHFTDKIFVTNKSIAEFTSRQEKININKFFIIPNPVIMPAKNINSLQDLKNQLNIRFDNFVVLFIGRFSGEKGLVYLLQAAKIIEGKVPGLKILLVGHGEQENYLREEIKKMKLDGICSIINDPARAREYYFLADLFVLPSTREGQSIVVYEALYAGLSVIASSLETIKEVINEGENGFLVKPEDPGSIAEKIEYLYQHREIREKFKINGPKSVMKFTPEKNTLGFESLLIGLLKNKRIWNQ